MVIKVPFGSSSVDSSFGKALVVGREGDVFRFFVSASMVCRPMS